MTAPAPAGPPASGPPPVAGTPPSGAIPSAVLLSHPTALAVGAISEQQYTIAMPFNVTLYSTSSNNISVTSNGLMTATSDKFSYTGYVDNPRPLYSATIPPGTAAPWWHYMNGTRPDHGIFYQIDAPNLLSVEWLLLDAAGQLSHFLITYSSDVSGHINFYYATAGDGGATSTVGVQGLDASNSTLHHSVPSNLTLLTLHSR